MKIKASIEVECEIDDSDFNQEKIEIERKNRYKATKEAIQSLLDELLLDDFDSARVKQVKIELNSNNKGADLSWTDGY